MEKKELTTILLDTVNGSTKVITVKDDLDDFYEKLNCDCIDIVYRTINGKEFSVMCDDEGLLKSQPTPSAIDKDMNIMLVGNLMFFNDNEEGELESLSEADIIRITDSTMVFMDIKRGKMQPVVKIEV